MINEKMGFINIFIANKESYKELLDTALKSLGCLGLVREWDYSVFGVPPAFAEAYSPIMFKAYLDNVNKTHAETFFGEDGLSLLVDKLKNKNFI